MPGTNIKLFDENKTSMLSDSDYGSNQYRENGVQAGIASSQLHNKFAYQVSLVSYAIAQLVVANGLDANDSDTVSTFVNNVGASILQKVNDKATTVEAQAGTNNAKWMTPLTTAKAIETAIGDALEGSY